MTNAAIVTTTINERPPSYEKWAAQGTLFVAGDENTPSGTRKYVESLGGHYLPTHATFPGMSYVPMRCIQRRNAAIWHAYVARDFDVIISVDDDNTPVSSNFVSLLAGELGHAASTTICARAGQKFVNLGEICLPAFHQRGTPYGVDTRLGGPITHIPELRPTVVVAQAMVVGDPDCDAIERIVHAPMVAAVANRIVVTPGVYAAFNSQATAWHRDWSPIAAVLPHVGRYDDIFASFIFHRMARTYHTALYAGDPIVRQDRNPHNLMKDLAAEHYGMTRVFDFCSALDSAIITHTMPLWMAYSELTEAVSHLLPARTVRFMEDWAKGWQEETL